MKMLETLGSFFIGKEFVYSIEARCAAMKILKNATKARGSEAVLAQVLLPCARVNRDLQQAVEQSLTGLRVRRQTDSERAKFGSSGFSVGSVIDELI